MASLPPGVPADLLQGPLLALSSSWPLLIRTVFPDWRGAFLGKGQAEVGGRAVARNGRVLLASPCPLAELTGQVVDLRLQTWHRTILAGEPARPFGILLCTWLAKQGRVPPEYNMRVARTAEEGFELCLDLGGQRVLEIRRS